MYVRTYMYWYPCTSLIHIIILFHKCISIYVNVHTCENMLWCLITYVYVHTYIQVYHWYTNLNEVTENRTYGHWLHPSLFFLITKLWQPDNHQHFTVLCIYCTSGTECWSHIPGSLYVCVIRNTLGVNRKYVIIYWHVHNMYMWTYAMIHGYNTNLS